jgi:methionyl-tRNA formyltransferase
MKKVLLITDNKHLYNFFITVVAKDVVGLAQIDYKCSQFDKPGYKCVIEEIDSVNLKREYKSLFSKKYDLIISLHCKQLFPKELVKTVRCINIHPGFNPYNRGWYPQVFSIINKFPLGVTIHEMDEELDHGDIIVQEEVPLYSYDTSLTAYNRVVDKEKELIVKHMPEIISGTYSLTQMRGTGNMNSKKDFDDLCNIDLAEKMTFEKAIDRLRALTHGEYNNAFFYDDQGQKIYVRIQLERTED